MSLNLRKKINTNKSFYTKILIVVFVLIFFNIIFTKTSTAAFRTTDTGNNTQQDEQIDGGSTAPDGSVLLTPNNRVTPQDTGYTLLEPIPYIDSQATLNIGNYIKALFDLGIALAVFLAIIEIIWGGVLYMSTDTVDNKSEGREKIKKAIYGLLLILAAWLILYTINPALIEQAFVIPSISINGQNNTNNTNDTPQVLRWNLIRNGVSVSVYSTEEDCLNARTSGDSCNLETGSNEVTEVELVTTIQGEIIATFPTMEACQAYRSQVTWTLFTNSGIRISDYDTQEECEVAQSDPLQEGSTCRQSEDLRRTTGCRVKTR